MRAAVNTVAANPELLDDIQRATLGAAITEPAGGEPMVRVEVGASGGRVVLVITGRPALDGAADSVAVSMTADEARELSNSLGQMILAV